MRFKAKPLRSVLFVPGNKEDWMRKAPHSGLRPLHHNGCQGGFQQLGVVDIGSSYH